MVKYSKHMPPKVNLCCHWLYRHVYELSLNNIHALPSNKSGDSLILLDIRPKWLEIIWCHVTFLIWPFFVRSFRPSLTSTLITAGYLSQLHNNIKIQHNSECGTVWHSSHWCWRWWWTEHVLGLVTFLTEDGQRQLSTAHQTVRWASVSRQQKLKPASNGFPWNKYFTRIHAENLTGSSFTF